MPAETIRVAIIEDQPNIRQGLQLLIDGAPGFHCVGSFGSMEEALAQAHDPPGDVLLVDIGLPGMSGIEGIRRLKQRHPRLPMVVLTIYDDDKRIFDAMCAGACGYLLKKTPPARLLESLKEVLDGGAAMSPEVARRVMDLFRDLRPPDAADYNLTPHEVRLLKMFADGHNNQTAAADLRVTPNTIRFHLRNIYSKLHVHSKSEAVSKALRQRIVP
jgi:DNA-binding NarL/FixJ family response regulator